MKVLYFHQHFSTPRGSSGTRSYEMARRLIERGHQVTMVCGSNKGCRTGLEADPVNGLRRGMVDGIDVIELCLPYSNHDGLLKRALVFLRFAMRSINVARKESYDLLFATSTPLTASIPGIAMGLFKKDKPFVFEVRDLWPELPKAMGMKNPLLLGGMSILEKLSYRAMDGGVALSPGIRKGMRRRAPEKTPIELVPNGCDFNLFQPSDSGFQADKLPDGYPADGLRCVFTGAHGLANGLDAVLDAGKVLQKRGRSDIRLIFVGDGKLKPALLARRDAEDLGNCLFFDLLPKDQLNEVMAQTDVGLMILANIPAFYYGTSPNKFFDYIASGLPVLNNYPGWLADLINEHSCGLAVPPENAEAFADALEWFADNSEQRKAMGMKSRQLAEMRFNRTALADTFVSFLESIQESKAGKTNRT